MADFNIRSDSVDVEQIMKQIRSRIREKRGVDYTEEQIRELATVRLEKFLDPKNLRSDLLEQFRRTRPALPEPPKEPPPVEPPYVFDDQTLFASHRGPLRFLRKLLRPILKLFFNPNTLNQILATQAQFNLDMLKRDVRRRVEFQQQVASFERSRGEWNVLYYEVLHNLVLETTRTGIEVKNLKMRVEALASRLDFSERRVRALEGVVQYRPEIVRPRDRRAENAGEAAAAGEEPQEPGGAQPGEGRRRRRRRRGRRGPGLGPDLAAGGAAVDETDASEFGGASDEDDEGGGPAGDDAELTGRAADAMDEDTPEAPESTSEGAEPMDSTEPSGDASGPGEPDTDDDRP